MGEVTGTPEVAPVVAPAPAASAPATPASGASSAPAAAAPAAKATAPVIEGSTAQSAFDFDTWDGKIETLPSTFHPVYNRAVEPYADYEDIKSRQAELQAWFDALGTDEENPEAMETKRQLEAITGERDAVRQELAAIKKQMEATEEAQINDWTQSFLRENQEVLADGKNKAKFTELLQAGWDPVVAIELVQLDPAVLELAAAAKQRGAPDDLAIEYAMAKQPQAAAPRRSAMVTAGADGSAQGGTPVEPSMKDAKTPEDRRLLAATRAFRKHGISLVK